MGKFLEFYPWEDETDGTWRAPGGSALLWWWVLIRDLTSAGGRGGHSRGVCKVFFDCLDFLRRTRSKVHKLTVRVNEEVLVAWGTRRRASGKYRTEDVGHNCPAALGLTWGMWLWIWNKIEFSSVILSYIRRGRCLIEGWKSFVMDILAKEESG